MKVNRWLVPVIALVVLFGSVGVGRVMGWWQTTGQSIATLPGATPDDIRGSSSLADLSSAFGISMEELYVLLSIPDSFAPETKLKDLEAYNEVSVVRGLVAGYLGLAWEESQDHEEPAPTATEPPVPTPSAPPAEAEHTGPTPVPAGAVVAAEEIKGRMSLREVSTVSGMPLDELYRALDLPADQDPDAVLRDLTAQVPGFETSVVREVVAAYQAQH